MRMEQVANKEATVRRLKAGGFDSAQSEVLAGTIYDVVVALTPDVSDEALSLAAVGVTKKVLADGGFVTDDKLKAAVETLKAHLEKEVKTLALWVFSAVLGAIPVTIGLIQLLIHWAS